MADITAAMVMKLRDETGLPMMDCKKALQETNGDFDLAKQKARESGKKIMAIRQTGVGIGPMRNLTMTFNIRGVAPGTKARS